MSGGTFIPMIAPATAPMITPPILYTWLTWELRPPTTRLH